MDKRCPRKLKEPPNYFCPLAVQRLRWREKQTKEPKENEERSAEGCTWAIRSHEHMFCFFKLISSQNQEKLTDSQIAHMLGVTEATVKKVADRAVKKLACMKEFREMKEMYGSDPIVEDRPVDAYEEHLNDMSGISISSVAEDEVKLEEDVSRRG